MKYLLLAFVISFVIPETPVVKYSIKGTVRGMASGWIFFTRPDSTGFIFGKRDSAKVTDGRFELSGEAQPSRVIVGFKRGKQYSFGGELFLDNGTLTIECDPDHMDQLKAGGTPAQDQYNRFMEKNRPNYLQGNATYGAKLRAESKHNKRAVDSLDNIFPLLQKKTAAIIAEQVKANPNSIVSAYLMKTYLSSNPDPSLLEPLYTTLSENIKRSMYGKDVLKALEAGRRTKIGSPAPHFEVPDQFRKKISLASYKGKYTLIDFWASWCGPCRAENPTVLAAYNHFKNRKFEVLSISMDVSKKDWLKAVSEDKLPWTQVCDLKGSKSEVGKMYGIKAVPMNYLLDKEGKIIAKNLRGHALEDKLAEVLR
ncbi:MAG: TlpA disulfide reductase family protein [Bacteroidota bacterium]